MSCLHRLPVLALAALLPAAGGAQPPSTPKRADVVYTVNDDRDLPDADASDGICEAAAGSGACTLRAALDEVNYRKPGAGWIAVGPRTVVLDLAWPRLHVAAGVVVTVAGAGAAATVIDGGGPGLSGPIITVSGPDSGAALPAAALTLLGITLANGFASDHGGAVSNFGTTHLQACRLTGNQATASGMGGGPQGHGGAIFNAAGARLFVVDSLLADNMARGMGGAISSDGWLEVDGSTFARNTAYAGGGGAIANHGRAVLMTSTFSGNGSAGSGDVWTAAGAEAEVTRCTFSGSHTTSNVPTVAIVVDPAQAPDFPAGVVRLGGSLLETASGPACRGTVVSLGYNLSADTSCGLSATGDQEGTPALLAPLDDNGGPTPTHLLLPGSAAIDAAFCTGLDQRGHHRPRNIPEVANAGNGCDVGAVEMQRTEVPR